MKTEEVEKKTLFKRSVARYALYIALFLLSFIVLNLLIATVLFIFKVSVQSWYVIAAGVLSVGLIIFLMWKRGWLSWKSVMVVVIIPALVFAGLTKVNSKIYDYTWDGNDYHKTATGLMMEGWNPLFESEEEFVDGTGNPIPLKRETFLWGNSYAKASYIFGANLGKITGSVESGKVLNGISIVIVFMLFLGILLYTNKSWVFAGLFATIAVTPTVVGAQFLTNYIDLLVFLYMFALAAIFFWLEYVSQYRFEVLAIFFMLLIMLINIKFSAFAYAGFLCAVYYIWYIYRLQKNKNFKPFFKQFTWTAVAAVIVGVFVVGLSTYPRNWVVYGHPLHPLMGEGKIDIMTFNSPETFKGKNNLEKFVIATFSKMDNVNEASKKVPELKIPFSVNKSEIEWFGNYDLRISGHGILFGGVLLVSMIVIAVLARRLYKNNKKLFIMVMLPVVMTLLMIVFMPETWWARYFPQAQYIVFAALIMLNEEKHKVARAGLYIMCGLMLLNNIPYGVVAIQNSYKTTMATRDRVRDFKDLYPANKCSTLVLATSSDPDLKFTGAYFNGKSDFREYENIEYELFEREDLEQYLYLMVPYLVGRCEE